MKREKTMEIVRISSVQFEQFRDSIEELIKETLVFNFPNAVIDKEYYANTLDSVSKYLEDGSAIVYIALNMGKVQGWIWCHAIQRFDKKRLHIANFAVCKDSRKSGIGHKLIDEAEKYAANNYYDGLDLLVTRDNVSAVSFYEKHGYEIERYLLCKEITK